MTSRARRAIIIPPSLLSPLRRLRCKAYPRHGRNHRHRISAAVVFCTLSPARQRCIPKNLDTKPLPRPTQQNHVILLRSLRAMNAAGPPAHRIAVVVSFGGTLPSVPLSLCSIFITMACVASSVFCRCHAKTASKHHGKLCRIRKSAVFCNLRAGIVRLNELLRGGVESCLD